MAAERPPRIGWEPLLADQGCLGKGDPGALKVGG